MVATQFPLEKRIAVIVEIAIIDGHAEDALVVAFVVFEGFLFRNF